jgi:hypothetical protein
MNRIKSIVAITIIALVSIALLTQLNYLRFFHMAGDSAGYVDLLKRVSLFGDMKSTVFAAAYPLFDLAKTADIFCQNQLINKYENNSFFQWHAYAIVYLIAWIGKLFTKNYMLIAAFVNATSVFLTFFGIFLVSRKNKLDYFEIIFYMAILVTFSPLIGSISGQYYFDRLFIPAAIFYFYFHLQRNDPVSLPISIFIILLTSLISERSSLMIGILSIYLSVFDCQNNTKYRYTTIFFGLASIAFYLVWSKLFQDSIYSNSISLVQFSLNIKEILNFDSNISKLTLNLFLMLSPLAILLILKPKYLLLFAIFIAPNILLTVGGAEKTGYQTHYHSYYLPILIVASLMGYCELKNFLKNKYNCYLILTLIFCVNIVNMRGLLFVVSPTLSHSFSGDSKLLFNNSEIRTRSDIRFTAFNDLISKITENNPTISSNEFVMPMLVAHGFAKIRMFPIGVNDSDYLLLETGINDPDHSIILPIYGDAKELRNISDCMYSKINDQYTEIGSKNIGAIKYRLMKRVV